MRVLEIVLYILAGISLLLGTYAGIALLGMAGGVQSMLSPYSFGPVPILNLLTPLVSSALSWLGGGILAVGVALALALFAAGRLIHRSQDLEARIARLEAGRS